MERRTPLAGVLGVGTNLGTNGLRTMDGRDCQTAGNVVYFLVW